MKRSVLVLVLIGGVVAMLAGMGQSMAACGTGGSPADRHGACETAGNNLQCGGGGTGTPAGKVYADGSGVDGCSDSGTAQGRFGVRIDGANSYVYTDADKDNPGATGWHKVSLAGCTRDKPGSQSYNSPGGGVACP